METYLNQPDVKARKLTGFLSSTILIISQSSVLLRK